VENVPRRPEFVQLEAQVRAAEAEIGVSRGEFLRASRIRRYRIDSTSLQPGVLSDMILSIA